MRDYKFRAWDDYHKKMLIVHNLYQHMDADGFTEFECTPKGWSKDGKDYILVSTTAHDNVKIMQYTGLKDKNGVEIYEGDIVRVTDAWGGNTKHQIKYLSDSNYPAFDLVPWLEVETNGLTYCMGSDAEIEVIGNIYENPELLEAES